MRRTGTARAMTLVELIIAAALAAAVVGGLVSALVLTSRALPTATKAADPAARDAAALESLSAELFGASEISEHTAHAIAFTVADRNGDSNPEMIRYAWNGMVGGALTREYNGETTSVSGGVTDFALALTISQRSTQTLKTVEADSGEITLASFSGWSGVSGSTITGYLLTTTSWPSEHVRITATMPSGFVRMEITKVTLFLRDSGAAAENMTCTLFAPAVAGAPEPNLSRVYGSPVVVSDSVLTTAYKAVDFVFSGASFTTPLTELCVAVKSSGGAGIRAQYVNNSSGPSNDTQTMLWTTDNGSSWQPTSSQRNRNDLYYTVSGRIYTSTTQLETVNRYFVTGVSAALRSVGSSRTATMQTQTVNTPEVATP